VQLTVVSSQRLLKHAKKRWVMLYSTIQHIVKKKMHADHKFFNWIALANLIFETLVRHETAIRQTKSHPQTSAIST